MLYVLYLHFAHVFLVVKDLHPETEYFDFYLIDYWLIERVKGRTFAKLKSTYIVWEFTLHENYNSLKVLPGGFWLVASVLTSVRPNLRRKITPLSYQLYRVSQKKLNTAEAQKSKKTKLSEWGKIFQRTWLKSSWVRIALVRNDQNNNIWSKSGWGCWGASCCSIIYVYMYYKVSQKTHQ